MATTPSEATFSQLDALIWKHLAERDWDSPKPRGLAISIALEANELLEHYQWSDTPVGDKEALAEELADIFIYALEYAHVLGVKPDEIIKDKLAKTAKKYPAANFKDKPATERREAWLAAKLTHREHKKSL